MINTTLGDGKSLFDLFNMTNPNCYQSMIIQSIVDNRLDDAISYCKELKVAIDYYKWEVTDKNSNYIDSLICQSKLERWQKISIMFALGNNVDKCREYLEDYKLQQSKQISQQEECCHTLNEEDRERLIYESIMNLLHPRNVYPYWTRIPRRSY